jgi:hypothetical protein
MVELLEYAVVGFFLLPTFFAFYLMWETLTEKEDDYDIS